MRCRARAVLEAFRWTGERYYDASEYPEWVRAHIATAGVKAEYADTPQDSEEARRSPGYSYLAIRPGYYIIRDHDGHIFYRDADSFNSYYEEVV